MSNILDKTGFFFVKLELFIFRVHLLSGHSALSYHVISIEWPMNLSRLLIIKIGKQQKMRLVEITSRGM